MKVKKKLDHSITEALLNGPRGVALTSSIRNYMAMVGKRGGTSKSAAKTKASRENGKKGGRPKGKVKK